MSDMRFLKRPIAEEPWCNTKQFPEVRLGRELIVGGGLVGGSGQAITQTGGH